MTTYKRGKLCQTDMVSGLWPESICDQSPQWVCVCRITNLYV